MIRYDTLLVYIVCAGPVSSVWRSHVAFGVRTSIVCVSRRFHESVQSVSHLVHHSIDSNFLDTLHFLQTRLEDKTEESFEVHCKVILLAVRVNNCRLQYFFILATMALRFTSNIIRFAILVTMSAMIQRTMCTSLKMMDSRACFGAGKSFNRTFWNACIPIISCKTDWTLRFKCSSSAGCYWGTGMITSNCHLALDNYTDKKLPFSIKCNDFHSLSAN